MPGPRGNAKVLIRADASLEIGSGHVMRCLTLAGLLREEGAGVVFACRDLPGGMGDYLRAGGYDVALLPGRESDAAETAAALRTFFPDGADWAVVDHYGLDAAWERQLRPHARRLMAIDDLADRRHDCDLLLDQNYYADGATRYAGLLPPACVTYLGPQYVLLREEFASARQRLRLRDGRIRRILLFFGGGDPGNLTGRMLAYLQGFVPPEVALDVVVGGANPHKPEIAALCERIPGARFHCQVSNMAELMNNADLAIGAGGATTWERCVLGLPALTFVLADNQLRTTQDLAAIGVVRYLGWGEEATAELLREHVEYLLRNPGVMQGYARKCLDIMSGWTGGRTIAGAMLGAI
ncbi:MAG: UDP-2,4-diacetamido-2,4,6-trideoxy-beta-L-altropyranose hydrolase [Deltaproteobacteria bacterium]|nr:MAG: UDP-2,4-diacetamido-2,4,6-trideoxy-beta-L-altropyranose hydrolase [Deltaproteobacteria bacterium]